VGAFVRVVGAALLVHVRDGLDLVGFASVSVIGPESGVSPPHSTEYGQSVVADGPFFDGQIRARVERR
jgi:hypothetical protein